MTTKQEEKKKRTIRAFAVMNNGRRDPDQVHLSRADALQDVAEARDVHPHTKWWMQPCTITFTPRKAQ